MYQLIRHFLLSRTEKRGRQLGSPTIKFDEKKIALPGEEIFVGTNFFRWLFNAYAFYLPLPPNAFGVVIFPDGTSQSMQGGLHQVPHGLYKLKYVDRLERFTTTAQVSEMSRDGEKITLKVLIRYRITDPITVLHIDHPVEALIEHVQTDVAQYIRTHDHNDIADTAEAGGESKILSFFVQRHRNRHPLSRAITITGVELKEFMGDKDYVEMRRANMIERTQSQIDKEKLERQKEMDKVQAAHKAEMDKLQAEHKMEISSLIARADAEKEALRSKILHESQMRDIQIENMRRQSQQRHELIVKAVEAISQALEPSGYPRNNAEIKSVIAELLAAIKEDNPDTPPQGAHKEPPKNNHGSGEPRPNNNERIDDLTGTLLNLLKSKK